MVVIHTKPFKIKNGIAQSGAHKTARQGAGKKARHWDVLQKQARENMG